MSKRSVRKRRDAPPPPSGRFDFEIPASIEAYIDQISRRPYLEPAPLTIHSIVRDPRFTPLPTPPLTAHPDDSGWSLRVDGVPRRGYFRKVTIR